LLPANLTPASRRQDHTILPSASKALSSEAPLAATASSPASVTIAIRPSSGVDGCGYKVICDFGKPEYFFRRDWTGRNSLIRLRKLDFTRKIPEARREDPAARIKPTGPDDTTPARRNIRQDVCEGHRNACHRNASTAPVAPALRCKDRVSTVLIIPRKASPPVRPAVAVARAPIARGVVPASNAPALADAGHQLTTVHRGSFCSDGSPGLGARPPTLGTSGA
jgi:hypothetical protein